MKNSEDKPIFQPKNSPSKQYQGIQGEVVHNHEEEVRNKGCNWFCFFCHKRRRNDGVNETDSLLRSDSESAAETWWETKLKKVKELSEKLAGPKWKNFIRKMSGYFNKRKSQKNRFQYDPYSYALNFDNGNGDDHKEGDHLLQDFSYRFAASLADDRQRSGSGM